MVNVVIWVIFWFTRLFGFILFVFDCCFMSKWLLGACFQIMSFIKCFDW